MVFNTVGYHGFLYCVIPSAELDRFCLIICQAAPKPNTFMPFGSGIHACPGNELAKLEILVLLHHLTTKFRLVKLTHSVSLQPFFSHMLWMETHSKLRVFRMFLKCCFYFFWCRWSVVGAKNGIQYGPFALPQNGLPITLYPKK